MSTPSRPPPATEPATLLRRLAGLAYDSLVLAAVLMGFTLVVVLLRGGSAVPPGTWWFEIGVLAVTACFFAGFWAHGGQTLGMRAWRLKLTRTDGGRVGWGRALLRFAGACVSLAPAGLGYWWSLFDSERRSWHDRLSRTRVIRMRSAKPSDA
jgi:uncharacterized RDD family membrane protein YckC